MKIILVLLFSGFSSYASKCSDPDGVFGGGINLNDMQKLAYEISKGSDEDPFLMGEVYSSLLDAFAKKRKELTPQKSTAIEVLLAHLESRILRLQGLFDYRRRYTIIIRSSGSYNRLGELGNLLRNYHRRMDLIYNNELETQIRTGALTRESYFIKTKTVLLPLEILVDIKSLAAQEFMTEIEKTFKSADPIEHIELYLVRRTAHHEN